MRKVESKGIAVFCHQDGCDGLHRSRRHVMLAQPQSDWRYAMTRLLAAAVLLIATAAPVFACDVTRSSSTNSHSTTASSNAKQASHSHS